MKLSAHLHLKQSLKMCGTLSPLLHTSSYCGAEVQGQLYRYLIRWKFPAEAELLFPALKVKSRGSSVGIALGYGLDDRGSRVLFPAGTENFSLQHRVQTGSGAHPASYPMGTSGSFPWG
jgi:hypothetical protein